jgi:hypothetical protein
MSIDPKKKTQKEIHSNQNYLNFIKKNHLLMYLYFYSASNKSLDLQARKFSITKNHNHMEVVPSLSKEIHILKMNLITEIAIKNQYMIHYLNFN